MSKALGAKTVLVLGANGFIGSHLVDRLATAGHHVLAFDHYSQPAQFVQHSQVEVVQGDIFDDLSLHDLLQKADYLMHSFSATTPYTADTDPYADISTNVLRNIQIFEKCVEAKVEKVAFISSGGAVYGRVAEEEDVTELTAPSPVSPYGIGKLTTEYYLDYFNRKYGLQSVSYRLSNPYGPRQVTKHNQGVMPSFINKIRLNEPITVLGDGSSTRDYIYIEDAVTMVTNSFIHATQTIYNLGSGEQTSVNHIIKLLQQALGTKPKIEYVDPPKTFLKHSNLNINRYSREFNSQATTSLSEGLAQTIRSLTA